MNRTGLLAAFALAGTLLAPTAPVAAQEKPWPGYRRGDGYTYYKESQTDRPRHGYEGFAGPPLRQSYCSYQRVPNRVCDDRGCRVTSWTLKQYCQ